MTSHGMIRIGDPARIGTAVEDIRAMLGIPRRDLARALAQRTGRSPSTWNSQLWCWERDRSPNPASLGPVLAELGYQLALVPLNEDGQTSGPASTLPAETPSTGVLGWAQGQKDAHRASEAIPEPTGTLQDRPDYPRHPCPTPGHGWKWIPLNGWECSDCHFDPPTTRPETQEA